MFKFSILLRRLKKQSFTEKEMLGLFQTSNLSMSARFSKHDYINVEWVMLMFLCTWEFGHCHVISLKCAHTLTQHTHTKTIWGVHGRYGEVRNEWQVLKKQDSRYSSSYRRHTYTHTHVLICTQTCSLNHSHKHTYTHWNIFFHTVKFPPVWT